MTVSDTSSRDELLFRLKERISSKLNIRSFEEILRSERRGPLLLSWSQQRLWFLEQLEDLGSAYHIEGALRLEGELDEVALQAALDAIVARHEALRTVFVRLDDEAEPHQVIQVASGFALARKDLSMLPELEREGELQVELERASAQRFDLSQGPLIRGELIRLSEQEHVLFVSMHHIVSDGWSIGVFTRELSALYTAKCQGEQDLASVLPVLPIQYADYAQWQRQWLTGERLAKQLSYWKERLTGAPSLLELPTDHTRPAVKGYAGSMVSFELSPELSQGLHALGRRHGATLFMVLQAAWAVLLGRLSGQDDIVIGTPVANRRRSELEGLIGFFVNTLALRTQIDAKQTVGELLAQVREETLEAFNHQDMPFEQVVEVVQPQRSLSHGPLFQVMLVLQNTPQTAFELPGLKLSMQGHEQHSTQFDLSVSLEQCADESLKGFVSYSTELFERRTVQRWLGYWQCLLSSMIADDTQSVGALAWVPKAELEQVTRGFNATQAPYPKEALIHELFEQQVEKTPEAVAVQYEGEQLTYAELNAKANQLAHRLRSLTDEDGHLVVRPDALVAISVERSLEMVVGLLGVLKAGAAYVPVDPEYPAERIEYMLEDSQARVLLTQKALRERLPASVQEAEMVLLDDDETYAGQLQTNPGRQDTGITSRNLAYVIYTSGSTGLPKGVMVEHRQQDNLLQAVCQAYGLMEQDRVLQFVSMAFDVAAQEIFSTLTAGAALVLRNEMCIGDSMSFWQACRTWGITIIHLPTAFWHRLACEVPERLPDELRLIVVGGERLDSKALSQWFERQGDRVVVLNEYGPTETAVTATMHAVQLHELMRPPIGRPLANVRVYVLDGEARPVPVGVPGEIHIGGVGVARGYLNRPELTAERFVADPFSKESGARMYRTGDLGRWTEDGTIEYVGRNDFQVKIRGFRVELGEIEARLAELPAVREVVVLAREDQPGDKRLVAYWTTPSGVVEADVPTVEQLRDHLKAELPAYMVPAAFVKLEAMPLTPNGKVDRKALPAPEAGALITLHAYEAPVTVTEGALAELWKSVLGVNRIGRNDSFFDLGGHSLLLVKLRSKMVSMGFNMSLADMMKNSTISLMSSFLEKEIKEEIGKEKIVKMRDGTGRPLFIVHDASGDIVSYMPLVSALSIDMPVYGINILAMDEHSPDLASIEGMAKTYSDLIRSVCPDGPYRLVGWCTAGGIAMEVASRLAEDGLPVEFVGILDTGYKAHPDEKEDEGRMKCGMLMSLVKRFYPDADVGKLDELDSIDVFEDLMSRCFEYHMVPSGFCPDELKRRVDIAWRITGAWMEYSMKHIPDNVYMFAATEYEDDGSRLLDTWKESGLDAPRMELIGGTHQSIMIPPHVVKMADRMSAILRALSCEVAS